MFSFYSKCNLHLIQNVKIIGLCTLMEPSLFVAPVHNKLQRRSYQNFSRRKPVRVMKHGPLKDAENFNEYFTRKKNESDPNSIFKNYEPVEESVKGVEKKKKKKVKESDQSIQISDELEEEPQEQKPLKNLHFKIFAQAPDRTKKLLKKVKPGDDQDTFLVEGWRLLGDTLNADLTPLAIFYSRSRLLGLMGPLMSKSEPELVNHLNVYSLYKTSYKTLQMWSTLRTSPGVTGVFRYSDVLDNRVNLAEGTLPLTVILDEVKDPTNAGSILRTLVAAGVHRVVFTKGCCNPFESKALRASAGSLYRINFETNVEWKNIAGYLPEEPSVYLADTCKENVDSDYFTDFKNMEVDAGRSEDSVPLSIANNSNVVNSVDEKLSKKIEQLNLQFQNRVDEKVYELNEDGERIYYDSSYEDGEVLDQFSDFPLPAEFYDNLDYYKHSNDVVLVIGGETGLSLSAKKFSFENGGIQVSIPMESGTDSLNSGVAAGILVYEMLKNFKTKIIKSEHVIAS